jgi:phosphohistidine phosphatase SixA
MGDLTGITLVGERTASTVGREFQAMGLSKTDIISSSLVRTVQTAVAMFGPEAKTLDWLQDCSEPSLKDIAALKKPGRNLVVVTHSGCMAHYERQLGVRGTPSADYASTFFVRSPVAGAPTALGYLNAASWPTFSKGMF